MKRLLLKIFTIGALLLTTLNGEDFAIKYNYITNYNQALQKAKEQRKDIVFILVSGYCPWCDRLKDEVLSLDHTNEIFAKHYIPLMLYSESDHYPSKFDSYVVPTAYIVSYKDESILESVYGYNDSYSYELLQIIEAKDRE